MSWYQLISVFFVVYCTWDMLPIAYAVVHGKSLHIAWAFRVLYTLAFMNLLIAFIGAPW